VRKKRLQLGTLLRVAVRLGPVAFELYQELGSLGYTPTRLVLLGLKAAAEGEGLVPAGQHMRVFMVDSEGLER